MTAIGLWALTNWRWALPALLCVLMAGYIGVQKIIIANRDATIAGYEADKAKEVAEALRQQKVLHDEDMRANNAILEKMRNDKVELQGDLNNARKRLAATAASNVCVGTDAGRAFRDGVRREPDAGASRNVQQRPPAGRTGQ